MCDDVDTGVGFVLGGGRGRGGHGHGTVGAARQGRAEHDERVLVDDVWRARERGGSAVPIRGPFVRVGAKRMGRSSTVSGG